MDIDIFVLNTSQKKNPPRQICNNNNIYLPILTSIKNEIKEYNLSANITEIENDNIPSKTTASIVLIIDSSFYVENDYLNKIISINNVFRDGAIFCGPTDTYTNMNLAQGIQKINKNYKKYKLSFGNSIVSSITKEIQHYPDIYCVAISGRAYNDFAYRPLVSPRHISINNKLFISQSSSKYNIYYVSTLQKIKYLDANDFTLESISDFYYDTGYQDGVLVNHKNLDSKREELWHRFVESPEILDNEMPRWLLDSSKETDGEYLENLVICKCKYQIGFYEGMMSRKLI